MPTALQRINLNANTITGQIPAQSSEDFDVTDFAEFVTTRYTISVSNVAKTTSQVFELIATKIDDDVEDQLYSRFPNGLNISVNLLKVGSETRLRLTNNELFLVNVSFVKTQL